MRRLRVLQLTNMYPDEKRPYFGIFVKQLVDCLASYEVDSTVVRIDGKGRWRPYFDGAFDLRARLRGENFHLLHAHYGLTGAVAATQHSIPLVLSLYGGDVNIPWQRQVTTFAALQADKVLFCSRRMQAMLPRRVDGEILSPGIDGDIFYPRDRSESRRRFGWSDSDRVVLFPSNPVRWDKDPDLFRAAIALCKTPGVRPVTFGGIPEADLPFMYSGADCMLLTSRSEGSPTVVKEGLACGLPVVSVDVGDVREQLDGLHHCVVVDDRRPETLADAVDETLASSERVVDVTVLDHASVARRVRDIYDRLA